MNHLRRFWAWLTAQLIQPDPHEGPAPAFYRRRDTSVSDRTPPPTLRLVVRGLCPFCCTLVFEGDEHSCATPPG